MSLSDQAQQREAEAREIEERRESGFQRFANAIGYVPRPECVHPARVPLEEPEDAERFDGLS